MKNERHRNPFRGARRSSIRLALRDSQLFPPSFPWCGGDGCFICDMHEHDRPLKPSLPMRGWDSARTSPKERGPIEAPPVHGISPIRPVKMMGLPATCEEGSALFFHFHRCGGDGCLICDLHESAGTTLVDQMRPASGWRCRCSKFRSREARNGTSFGIEQMRNVVWSRRSAGAGGAPVSAARILPFRKYLCKD